MKERTKLSRRTFLAAAGAAVGGPYFVPSHVFAAPGRVGANDRIVTGHIGVGGMGRGHLHHVRRFHKRGQTQIALCLKDGKIIAASGNGGLRLGQLLYDKRLISQERLQEALQKANQSGRRVGEVLLDFGYVSEDELRDLIHHQIREAVMDLSIWGEGEFTYQECQVEFDQRGVEDINTMGLILEAARVIDEWATNQKM